MSSAPLTISRRALAVSLEPCVFCSFNRTHGAVQKRHLAARRAPSTRHQAWRNKAHAINPEWQAAEKRRTESALAWTENTLIPVEDKVVIYSGNYSLASRMSNRMTHFYCAYVASGMDDGAFDTRVKNAGITLDEIYESTFLLRNMGTPWEAKLGRRLVRCCDRAGHAEATIQTVASLLRQDIVNPGMLRLGDAQLAQSRLKELGDRGNLRALVLLGKLAERRGDPKLAISLYERASDRFLELVKGENTVDKDDQTTKRLDELSSPWMELAILHLRRGDRRKALGAYMLGIDQDDPMAYLMLARLDYQLSGEYTVDWLYNMTKAAASGHARAAFALGEYYANTKAPPPIDEITTQTEPASDSDTADSPGPATPKPAPVSLFTRIHHFLTTSFLKPTIELDPTLNIAHHAAAVQDPVKRASLAEEWFKTAVRQAYLPSYLPLARLRFRKHILPQDNLSGPLFIDDADAERLGAVENPLHDISLGRACLNSVFVAHKVITTARRETTVEAEFRARVGHWAEFPDILEDYENNLDGLLEEAKELADIMKIDVESTDFGVLYKYHRPT